MNENEITLTKNGIKHNKWNIESRQHETINVPSNDILHYLRLYCNIEPNTTLEDILKWINSETQLKEFLIQYSWCKHFHEYISEIDEKFDENHGVYGLCYINEDSFDKIQISWFAQFFKHSIEQRIERSCDAFPICHGIGKDNSHYCISLSHLSIIAKKEVTINNNIRFHNIDVNQIDDPPDLESATKEFTLLEILDTILHEISFYGNREHKEALRTLCELDHKD